MTSTIGAQLLQSGHTRRHTHGRSRQRPQEPFSGQNHPSARALLVGGAALILVVAIMLLVVPS